MSFYDHYRGSRAQKRKKRLLIAAIVLLLLILAAVALLVFGDFMTYSADGFRFNWPFQQEQQTPSDPAGSEDQNDSKDPNYVIDDKPADPQDNPSPSFSLAEGQTGFLPVDTATYLTQSPASLPAGICNGYAITIKDAAGNRFLPSSIDRNTTQGLSADAKGVSSATAAYAAQEGISTSAVISAFPDNILPRKTYISSGIKSGKTVWQDNTGSSWLNPYASGTQAILVELVKQCKNAGFNEIILTDFRFPVAADGDIAAISYNTSKAKTQALNNLAKKLSDTAGEDVKLSCVLTAAAASQLLDEESGQSVDTLSEYFDRVYVQTVDASEDFSTLQNALSGAGCELALWILADEVPASLPNINFVLAGK